LSLEQLRSFWRIEAVVIVHRSHRAVDRYH
jgi:hypothetical protein